MKGINGPLAFWFPVKQFERGFGGLHATSVVLTFGMFELSPIAAKADR